MPSSLAWYSTIFFNVVVGRVGGHLAAVDEQRGNLVDAQVLGQLGRGVDRLPWSAGVAAQAATFAGSRPALVTALFRVSVAPSGVARPSWPSKTADANWKNAVLPPSLATHDAVGRGQ